MAIGSVGAKSKASKKVAKTIKKSKPTKKISVHTTTRSKVTSSAKSATKKIANKVKKTVKKTKLGDLLTHTMDFEEIVASVSEGQLEEVQTKGAKFNIGVQHNAQAMYSHELPYEYGKNQATLLVVDPKFVFTYWEIRQDTVNDAQHKLHGHGKLTLRFYDITNTHKPEISHYWDVEVFDRLGNWYLKLGHPEQLLCLDVGLKGPHGEFIVCTRSNIMKLPPQSLARPGPIKWMVVTPDGGKMISDVEEYTDADLALLKKILGPYFFDLLMRGRFASIAGSSMEAVFYDVQSLLTSGVPSPGESPSSRLGWVTSPGSR